MRPRRHSRSLWISQARRVTFSWQKVLGGEAAHGMLVLSPRAVERLENYRSALAVAEDISNDERRQANRRRICRRDDKHPSMLCVEDYLDALEWARSIGGLDGFLRAPTPMPRTSRNGSSAEPASTFLAKRPAHRARIRAYASKIADPKIIRGAEGTRGFRQEPWRAGREGGSGLRLLPIATRRLACAYGAGRRLEPPTWRC